MTSPHDGVLQIGCDGCVMASTAACGDCLVTFLCAEERAPEPRAVVLDLDEHRAVRRLQAAGLLPESRYRARSG
jgi:hypothetical protein